MRMFFAALATAFCATTATADVGRLIVESDTGIVFGDLDCHIESHQAGMPRFSVDDFDYLQATVEIESICVTRTGREFTMRGEDTVPFLELRFDWRNQAWYSRNHLIATRLSPWQIEMNPDYDYRVWTDGQESHTAFRVEVREWP